MCVSRFWGLANGVGWVGRALAVGAERTFDLWDDLAGLNAGVEMKGYLEGEAKGFMEFFGQRV